MECLKDNLSRAQIAHDEAETREQEAITDCQCTLKMFKFEKYKEGYEDGKRGAPPRYSLDIGSFLKFLQKRCKLFVNSKQVVSLLLNIELLIPTRRKGLSREDNA